MKRYDANISNEAKNNGVFGSFISVRRVQSGLFGFLLIMATVITSCNQFLDVVPDDVATLDNAFTLRQEAEKYLFTCYSYLPKDGDPWFNIGQLAADEIWLNQTTNINNAPFAIAVGLQNKSQPLVNAWAGNIFAGIRSCNIFLENMNDLSKVPDISPSDRRRWIGEGEFLKAYYHYYLLRMYGPIPIIDKNVAIDVESYVKRMPVDYCVDYISALLDSASQKLPVRISNETQEMGRITQPIALAIKAKLWLLAASPLFNGNSDFAGFAGNDGVELFNSAVDVTKWQKARDAAKAAIDAAEASGNTLFKYTNSQFNLNDTTVTQLSIRQAVSEPWNSEQVWANSNSYFEPWSQSRCNIALSGGSQSISRWEATGEFGAPIKIAKMFYSSNGVPIDEDKTLDFSNYTDVWTAGNRHRFNIKPGYQTARLNFDREPRFYADLGFDGGVWYKKDSPSLSDFPTFYAMTKSKDTGGQTTIIYWNETGYYLKKLVNWEMIFSGNQQATYKRYPWPEIRLAELYLMYAEALHEAEPMASDVYVYLDKVRERAGLKGVVESWSNYSDNPGKPGTVEGLRAIIHRERLIELAFEGHRFWDLRRWKEAASELNQDITGWTIAGATAATYSKERFVYAQTFVAPRDYLWPIGNNDTRKNLQLVENPGW